MKKYRDISAKTQSDRLAHYGMTKESSLPHSLKEMGSKLSTKGSLMADEDMRPRGERVPHRKSGGRVTKGKGKTTVNVIVAPSNAQPGPGMIPRPMPAPVPAQAMPPHPQAPMPGPVGAPPPQMMPPPGMMPRKHGGRVMTAGAGSGEGRLEKAGKKATKVSKDGVANGI